MVISSPSGHVGPVVPPARYPIVAAAAAAAATTAPPDSYESHFPLAHVTRAHKRTAADAADASTGPFSPSASSTPTAAGAGSDTMALCNSYGAADMYDN